MHTLHLLHLSHHDFGYTDSPARCWTLQMEWLRRALDLADATAGAGEDGRFRWTCESALVAQRCWESADAAWRNRFAAAVARGQLEVTAMPCNLSPLVDAADADATLEGLAPFFTRFPPAAAIQDDINGLPWGWLPRLARLGVRGLYFGVNTFSGGTPMPRPAWFRWQGPGGELIPTAVGFGYNDGFAWFHAGDWRRGPVPTVDDPWFHAPEPQHVWPCDPASLRAAHTRLHAALGREAAAWPHGHLAVGVTNQWRFDNDPPEARLPAFVQAWNAAGLSPRLRLSTLGQYLDALRTECPEPPVLCGDWPDFWADGFASTPQTLAIAQDARRRLARLPTLATALGVAVGPLLEQRREALRACLLHGEHTWGAYDSLARPEHLRTLGNRNGKDAWAFAAADAAAGLESAALRGNPHYRCTADAEAALVVNPAAAPLTGWASVPARSLRRPAQSLGGLPLETVLGEEWSDPHPGQPQQREGEGTWGLGPVQLRVRAGPLAAGATRRLAFADQPATAAPTATPLRWRWHEGRLAALELAGRPLIDPAHAHAWGGLIHEGITGEGARAAAATHGTAALAARLRRSPARVLGQRETTVCGVPRVTLQLALPGCRVAEQTWELLPECAGLDLITDLELERSDAAQVIYLAFPFAAGAAPAYFSLGHRTGLDQRLPGSCGGYVIANDGWSLAGPATGVFACPDTPLCCVGDLGLRDGRRSGDGPVAPFLAPVLLNTLWPTNFDLCRGGRLVVRHRLRLGDGSLAALQAACSDPLTLPTA